MPETNVGIGILEDRLAGLGSPVPFDAAHARIGVGDGGGSVPAATPSDTALAAPVNTAWKPMDATYPQRAGTTVSWRATFGPSDANFPWNEWAVDNGAGGGPGQFLSHKGVALGTKVAGSTWTFTASITHS
jgi:hypothetical protein